MDATYRMGADFWNKEQSCYHKKTYLKLLDNFQSQDKIERLQMIALKMQDITVSVKLEGSKKQTNKKKTSHLNRSWGSSKAGFSFFRNTMPWKLIKMLSNSFQSLYVASLLSSYLLVEPVPQFGVFRFTGDPGKLVLNAFISILRFLHTPCLVCFRSYRLKNAPAWPVFFLYCVPLQWSTQ